MAKEQRAEGSAWSRKQLQHFEQRLADERKRAIEQIGTFDEHLCEECGRQIAFDRLEAIPYVQRCVDCKQTWENGQTRGE